MDPLSQDLLIEILKRLPVKSLLQCRCVSKHWSRLIKGPDLVTSHLRFNKSSSPPSILGIATGPDCFRHKQHEELFEHSRIGSTEKTKIRFPWRPKTSPHQDKPYILIIGHCNGLVLASDTETHLVYEHTRPKQIRVTRYIICNPIARRFQILPESDIELPKLTFEDDYEDRAERNKMSAFGLGFIDNLVYKIVRITYGVRNLFSKEKTYEPARAEVYDSRTCRWREVSVNAGLSYEYLEDGVYNSFDGCLYWLGRGYGERKRYSTLVSFHLVDEIWYETLLPYKSRSVTLLGYEDEDTQDNEEGIFGVYGVCQQVGVLGESVVMLVGDQRDRMVWNVWKMNKEDDHKVSWTHMYGFNLKGSPDGFCRDAKLLLMKCGSLALYDPRKMDDVDCPACVAVPDFVESLILLDGESLVVEDASEEEEPENPKSFWEEDEDLGDFTSVFDEDRGDLTSLYYEDLGDLTSLFDENL